MSQSLTGKGTSAELLGATLERMAGALATVDMNIPSKDATDRTEKEDHSNVFFKLPSSAPHKQPQPSPQAAPVSDDCYEHAIETPLEEHSFNVLRIEEHSFESSGDESCSSDNSSIGSYSAVSSLSADESHQFDQFSITGDVVLLHEEHDNDTAPSNHDDSNATPQLVAASPCRPPRELRPPRPPSLETFQRSYSVPTARQLRGNTHHHPHHSNLLLRNGPPRPHHTLPRVPFVQTRSLPVQNNFDSIESPLSSPVFRPHLARQQSSPDSMAYASNDMTNNNNAGNHRPRLEVMTLLSPSGSASYVSSSSNNMRRSCHPPTIHNNKSFESNITLDSSSLGFSDAVSSIINRGPNTQVNRFQHHHRSFSECTLNTYGSVPDDAIIINGKVVDNINHRDSIMSPGHKQLLGSRPRRLPPGNNGQQHRRVASNGSWGARSMMTEESTCLSSTAALSSNGGGGGSGGSGAPLDSDDHSASVGPASYYQAKKPKSKSKNIVAEEIKYKMSKLNILSPVPLGRKLKKSLMKGKMDGDDKVILERAKSGFLA